MDLLVCYALAHAYAAALASRARLAARFCAGVTFFSTVWNSASRPINSGVQRNVALIRVPLSSRPSRTRVAAGIVTQAFIWSEYVKQERFVLLNPSLSTGSFWGVTITGVVMISVCLLWWVSANWWTLKAEVMRAKFRIRLAVERSKGKDFARLKAALERLEKKDMPGAPKSPFVLLRSAVLCAAFLVVSQLRAMVKSEYADDELQAFVDAEFATVLTPEELVAVRDDVSLSGMDFRVLAKKLAGEDQYLLKLADFGFSPPTAALCNVRVPCAPEGCPDGFSLKLYRAHNFYAPIFRFAGADYVRLTAQIYNELADFAYVGEKVLESLGIETALTERA